MTIDYEKKYKEALERAKQVYKTPYTAHWDVMKKLIEHLFPELKESEDEGIRKALVRFHGSTIDIDGIKGSDIVAWLEKQNSNLDNANNEYWRGYREGKQEIIDKYAELEKQAEQNPMNKNKHKFHEGDWIVFNNHHNSIYQVEKIENYEYTLRHFLGGSMHLSFSHEDMIRTWTIQDAKDGNVLTFRNNISGIIICKSPTDYDTRSYCRFVNDNLINKEESGWDSTLLVPATKEQRDLLFQKMHEAGYEWDADRKELRKIENEIEIPFGAKDSELQEVTYYIPQGFHAEIDDNKVVIKKGEKPTAWSEEDERMLNSTIWHLRYSVNNGNIGYSAGRLEDWLKSLKDRIK